MNTNENILEDIVTKTNDNINITANNLTVDCITSANNKFNLDSDGNLIVNSITATTAGNNINFDSIYPVGAIYLSVNNINPSSLFGGTWEQIKDRFLLASGTKYQLGNIGGEETHKLTENEMPSHSHKATNFVYNSTNNPFNINPNGTSKLSTAKGNIGVDFSGGNEAHNNMPPYLVVNIWKRIS